MSVASPVEQDAALVLYTPTRLQRIVHLCPADRTVFGGSAGPGKTICLYMDAIRKSLAQPGRRNVFIRRTYPELKKVMDETKRWMPPGAAKYNENDNRWIFTARKHPLDPPEAGKRSSIIQFSHLHREDDVYAHQSEEYDGIYPDEATHLTGKMIEYLFTRNRSSLPNGHAQTLMGTNPGNIGHQYIKDGWVFPVDEHVELLVRWDDTVMGSDGKPGSWVRTKPDTWGRVTPFVVWRPTSPPGESKRPTRCFIPAFLKDNPHVDPAYVNTLEAITDERLKAALLEGSWDIYEGQAFHEWNEKIHVVDDAEVEPHWRKWRSVDYGWDDYTAVYWHAYNPDKEQVVTYRELYVNQTADKQLCDQINALSPKMEMIDQTVADRSMFRQGNNEFGMSRADIWNRYGVTLTPAINDRTTGFIRVKNALAINQKTREPNWIISRSCYNLRRTLPMLSYALNGKEDIEEKGADDHCYDCLTGRTMILTSEGEVPICAIGPGKFVMTRSGWRMVTDAWMQHPEAPVFDVTLSTGRVLTGTANHPVWVEGKGWVPLDALRYGDILNAWNDGQNPSYSRASPIGVTPTVPVGPPVHTSTLRRVTELAERLRCTATSIASIMEKSPMGLTSTIGTETHSTTTSAIFRRSHAGSTPNFTPLARSGWRGSRNTPMRFALRLLHGTHLRRAESGTGSTPQNLSINQWNDNWHVTNVEVRLLSPTERLLVSAQTPASRSGGAPRDSTTLRESARGAGEPSLLTVTKEQSVAPVYVVGVTESGNARVYNLTVDGEQEFYAEGVLTHNSVRYGLNVTSAFYGGSSSPLAPITYRVY